MQYTVEKPSNQGMSYTDGQEPLRPRRSRQSLQSITEAEAMHEIRCYIEDDGFVETGKVNTEAITFEGIHQSMPGCQVDLIRQQLCEELLRFHDGRRCDQPLTRAEFDALKLPALRGVVKDKDVAFDVACHLSNNLNPWIDLILYLTHTLHSCFFISIVMDCRDTTILKDFFHTLTSLAEFNCIDYSKNNVLTGIFTVDTEKIPSVNVLMGFIASSMECPSMNLQKFRDQGSFSGELPSKIKDYKPSIHVMVQKLDKDSCSWVVPSLFSIIRGSAVFKTKPDRRWNTTPVFNACLMTGAAIYETEMLDSLVVGYLQSSFKKSLQGNMKTRDKYLLWPAYEGRLQNSRERMQELAGSSACFFWTVACELPDLFAVHFMKIYDDALEYVMVIKGRDSLFYVITQFKEPVDNWVDMERDFLSVLLVAGKGRILHMHPSKDMQCPVNMVMSHLKKGCTDKEDLTEHIRYLSLADVTAEDKYPPVDISSRDTPDGGFLEWETPPQKTKISAIFIRYVRPSLPERPIPLAWDDSKRCGTVVPFSDMSTMLWPEISSEGSKVYVTLPVLEYITKGNVMRFVDPNKNRIANEKFCNTASDDQRKLRCYVTIEDIPLVEVLFAKDTLKAKLVIDYFSWKSNHSSPEGVLDSVKAAFQEPKSTVFDSRFRESCEGFRPIFFPFLETCRPYFSKSDTGRRMLISRLVLFVGTSRRLEDAKISSATAENAEKAVTGSRVSKVISIDDEDAKSEISEEFGLSPGKKRLCSTSLSQRTDSKKRASGSGSGMNAPPSSPIQKISKPKATGRKGPFTNEDLTFQWKNNFGISKEDSSITYPVTDTEGKVIMCNQLGRSQVKYTRVLFEQKTQASFMGERYFSTSRKEMIIDPLSTMVYKRFLELEKGPRDSESVIPENMFTWTAEMTDLMEGSQEDHRDEAFTYRKVTMDHLKDLRSSIDGFRGHVDKLINFMDDSKFCVVSPEDNSDSTVEVDGKMMDHAFYDTMESFVGDLDVDIAGFTFDLEAIKEDMKKEYQASGTLKWRETFEVDEDAYEAANGDDKGDDAINCHDGAGVSCNDADADSDADA